MSELVRLKGSLRGLGGTPRLDRCFAALEFDAYPTLATHEIGQSLGARTILKGKRKAAVLSDPIASHALLWDCRRHWLTLCRRWHPDTGGDDETMALLNVAWGRVEELFARRGIRLD